MCATGTTERRLKKKKKQNIRTLVEVFATCHQPSHGVESGHFHQFSTKKGLQLTRISLIRS